MADLLLVQQVFEAYDESCDRQGFLELLVRQVAELGKVETCSLMLVDDEGQLFIAAACGLPQQLIEETRIAPGEGIAGHVLASGESLLIKDLQQDSRFSEAAGRVPYQTRSLLSVPLLSRGKRLGVLNVNNKQNRQPFAEADLTLLRGIARQTALAIENFELLTALQQRNLELERSQAELQRNAEGRSRLVCNLSHELKTPLTSVVGYLELLINHQEQIDLLDQQRYLDEARSEGLKMRELINAMLLLFTLDSGGGRWEPEVVDFSELLELQLESRSRQLEQQQLQLRFEPRQDCLVLGDRDRLGYLVGALLDNAIKFNRPGGVIALELEAELTLDGELLRWRLHNDGGSVPPEAAETIFDQYIQLGEIHSNKPAGVGIGLSICKAIVDRLQGEISLEAAGGEGTTIVVRLPRYDSGEGQ